MTVDFNREVYSILGLPFDAVDMAEAVRRVRDAAMRRRRCFLSTPNLNWLAACLTDTAFRDSVIVSDLSIADGMPLVWVAKLLQIPISERVAGSTLFDTIRSGPGKPISVFFLGGPDGVAETACRKLSEENRGLACVGYESPGFGSIEEMSTQATIERINATQADFLVIALGARKGQAWINRNRRHLNVPILSHLGAVVNFVAGTARRAPEWIRNMGLEWLWRLREEPALYRRYILDGMVFLRLLVTRVLPHAWFILRHEPVQETLDSAMIEIEEGNTETIIRLRGAWVRKNLRRLQECFSAATRSGKHIRLQMQQVIYVDCAFIGLLMLLHEEQKQQGKRIAIDDLQDSIRRIFRYACAEFLLDA